MGKTRCPKCGNLFNDDINRYVIGSLSNTLKFGVNLTCRWGASALACGLNPNSKNLAKLAGRAGGKFADSIGCGYNDMNGWKHKCPKCKHEW